MRRGGVLVHPTSLPGPHGAGDIASARRLLEWIERAGMNLWQFLPLVPADKWGCPYKSASAFARDPMLISLTELTEDGWLESHELPSPIHATLPIDFPAVSAHRTAALALAADRVVAQVDLDAWSLDRPWVDDWALFCVLTEAHGPRWQDWPQPARDRHGNVLADAREAPGFARAVALQWLFAWQWDRLRREAKQRGIALWGDLPIFVAPSSVDTWANPELFLLDDHGEPRTVSGVPPDAFSADGQLWGHPHYDNPAHESRGYSWWKARFEALLELCDCVRIDHFRGLVGVWHVPADAQDARGGRWEEGLGSPLLEALTEVASPLPVIAEDLGVITEQVIDLRDEHGLSGMAVLQFGFSEGGEEHLPHHHRRQQVVYTGTHDNQTALGWFREAAENERARFEKLAGLGADPSDGMVRLAWASVADTAIAPLQDLLRLDGRYRTNTPGIEGGNWRWRVPPGQLTFARADELARQLQIFER